MEAESPAHAACWNRLALQDTVTVVIAAFAGNPQRVEGLAGACGGLGVGLEVWFMVGVWGCWGRSVFHNAGCASSAVH